MIPNSIVILNGNFFRQVVFGRPTYLTGLSNIVLIRLVVVHLHEVLLYCHY